ncbi:MAG TPA: class E sortase [Candidatus Saccharimonadia bacterium]|nr:class E sortase [Candidatus Saccharimonadia bacterium]
MSLSKINNVLLALIIVVNAYVIVAPLWPGLVFKVQSHQGKQQQLEAMVHPSKSAKPAQAAPRPNSVIIPSMLLDQPILEGTVVNQYKVLDKGIWRWPRGSTPDRGGNTVLIGHRFTYTNPRGVFYFLNKVKMGDEMAVFWSGKEYLYKVQTIQEVSPHDTAIENPSAQPELTLFTCTPLWLPKDRLVVVAGLEKP